MATSATASIDRTLKNVRKLLKTGGKLVLFEATNPNTLSGFTFGLLKGWWLSEEAHRQYGPLMTVPTWSEHLERSGFSGVDLCLDQSPDHPQTISLVSWFLLRLENSQQCGLSALLSAQTNTLSSRRRSRRSYRLQSLASSPLNAVSYRSTT